MQSSHRNQISGGSPRKIKVARAKLVGKQEMGPGYFTGVCSHLTELVGEVLKSSVDAALNGIPRITVTAIPV